MTDPAHEIHSLLKTLPVACPCGDSHRLISQADRLSFHVVDISEDAKAHYHKRLTEYYYVLGGSGDIEMNGVRHPIQEGDLVVIPPNVRHRAIGKLRILNIIEPGFDKSDEHFDE